MQLAKTSIIIAILFTLSWIGLHAVSGAATSSVSRVFYFSASSRLTTSSVLFGTSPINVSLTTKPLLFNYPNPLVPPPFAKVSGTMTLSLWLATNKTSSITPVIIEAGFNESLGRGGNLIQLEKYQNNVIGTDPRIYNFTYNLDDQPLFQPDVISVSLRLAQPTLANVTMMYGSSNYPSSVTVPMIGYMSLDSLRGTPILITDPISQSPSTNFDLNSSFRQVRFQVFVDSALGFDDIDHVNLTIVGPNGLAVFSNPMDASPPSTPPFEWHVFWSYPSTADEGVYHAWVDIFDHQNNWAYSLHGSSTFGLTRTNPITRAALDILPYVSITGVGIGAVAIYYRRRKTKSYFAPFDYFNTLTGGELAGGMAVTIEGNTGSGKTMLAEQLMFEDLKRGRPCVFLATGDFPSNVRASMRTMGLDVTGYEQNGLLTFVDGYSAEAGQESREKIYVPSLGDLTTLGMKISSSLPDGSFKGGSLYFDSLTPLASIAKPENLVSFVQTIGARVKGLGGKAFFTLGPSVAPAVQKQLEEMADCVVQMEAFEEGGTRKSRLRISKLRARRHQQGWVIYTIEDGKGIIFYSKNPKP